MSPFFCYIHQGLYVSSPDQEGCQYSQCIEFARKEIKPSGIHMARFGGSDATKQSRLNSDNFHRDMYAFKDAYDQGVRPDQCTQVAAEAALKEAEATEHGTD